MLRAEVIRSLQAAGVGAGSRLCCAFSGGVDSVVLLELLADLQAEFGYVLEAAHVHHGLSAEADRWARFCVAHCAARSIPCHLFHVQVSRHDPAGIEAAARQLRYEVLDGLGSDWLVLGHHQDDQAETVLLQLLRGSGVRGAAGMRALTPATTTRSGRLRPLLGCRRRQIETWARARGLLWVEDDSNVEVDFRRNHLRHRVLPLLEESHAAAVPMLARAATHFRGADELLGELAALDQQRCGGQSMQRDCLLGLSDARIANLLRWQLHERGWPAPPQRRLAEALRQLRSVERPLRLDLGAAACCVYRGRVWLEPAQQEPPRAQDWDGESVLRWAGGRVDFADVKGAGLDATACAAARQRILGQRRAGMRLRLHGDRHRRSLKQLCQQAGIPAWLRARLPVLWIDDEPAWVGGIGIMAEFGCPPGADGVLPQWHPDGDVAVKVTREESENADSPQARQNDRKGKA